MLEKGKINTGEFEIIVIIFTLGTSILVGPSIIWFFSMYFKLAICYYGITLALTQIFKLKSYKILIFPLAFLLVTFSIFLYLDIVYFQYFLAHTWTPYSLTICFFLPCIILFTAKVKKVKTNKESGR